MPYKHSPNSPFVGSNKLDSRRAFYERAIYRSEAWPKYLPYIDFIYERPHYGRINQHGDAIIIRPERLTEVEDGIYCLSFVSEAYRDFRNYIRRHVGEGRLPRNTRFTELALIDGWHDPFEDHGDHIKAAYNAFVSYARTLKVEISNWKEFLSTFMTFMKDTGGLWKISTGAFMRARGTPEHTGLSLRLLPRGHSYDRPKQKFIDDPVFDYFVKTAKQFGFLVDKNAPWRLVADVQSKQLWPYIWEDDDDESDKNLDNLLFRYYNQCCTAGGSRGAESILGALWDLYASYRPYSLKECGIGEGGSWPLSEALLEHSQKAVRHSIWRRAQSGGAEEAFESMRPRERLSFWLRLRLLEEGKSEVPGNVLDRELSRALTLMKVRGEDTAYRTLSKAAGGL